MLDRCILGPASESLFIKSGGASILDQSPIRHPWRHPLPALAFLLCIGDLSVAVVAAHYEDHDPTIGSGRGLYLERHTHTHFRRGKDS